MSTHQAPATRAGAANPWVIDVRELNRRPGASRSVEQTIPAGGLGLAGIITVPADGQIELELLLESVVEGILATGSAWATVTGECSRCLDDMSDEVEVQFTELYAYPESATDQTADEFEVARLNDDMLDLEQVVRDAFVLALPQAPLCSPDCPGLCVECGGRLAELGSDHSHEIIDPRWAALTSKFGDNARKSEEK